MEGLRERLSEWRLDCKELTVYTDHLDGISEAQDFQNRLSQLCAGLQTTGGTRLCVGGFRWNARMLRGYVAAFPALAERGVGKHALMHIGPLTDALLGKVLKVRWCACRSCCDRVSNLMPVHCTYCTCVTCMHLLFCCRICVASQLQRHTYIHLCAYHIHVVFFLHGSHALPWHAPQGNNNTLCGLPCTCRLAHTSLVCLCGASR